jgi:hypothetical protein
MLGDVPPWAAFTLVVSEGANERPEELPLSTSRILCSDTQVNSTDPGQGIPPAEVSPRYTKLIRVANIKFQV